MQVVAILDVDAAKASYARIEAEFGTANMLINKAGSSESVFSIKDIDLDDFWSDFVRRLSHLTTKTRHP